ncbi:MAG: hypothetical protein V4727_06780 [Verrucomicrobiota bacterium]
MKYASFLILLISLAFSAFATPVHEVKVQREQQVPAENTHWLTTSSGVRHNST